MAALCPLLMRFSDYQLRIQKRQGWEKVCNEKKRVGSVLFSTGDNGIGSLRKFFLLPSLLSIDITTILLMYDLTWLLTTSEHWLPLDTTCTKSLISSHQLYSIYRGNE